MGRTTRFSVLAAVVTTGSLVLSGCGTGDDTVEIRVAWWGPDSRHQVTEEIIELYEDQNPDVRIVAENADWTGYWDRLATQSAARDAPDVMQMDGSYLREYAENGTLLELDGVDLSSFDEQVAEVGDIDGTTYAASTGVSVMVMVATPEIFEEAGVDLPDDTSWTWDDFADIATEISENTDAYGAQGPLESDGLNMWLRQHGQELTDEEGNISFEPDAAAEYFEFIAETVEAGGMPPAAVMSETQGVGPEQSLQGQNEAAMSMIYDTQINQLATAAGTELIPLRFPTHSGDASEAEMFSKSAMYWSASSQTDHPEEVQDFIDFLANSEEAAELNLTDRGLPANEDVRDAILPKINDQERIVVDFIEELDEEYGDPMLPAPLGLPNLQDLTFRLSDDVYYGNTSPEDAAESLYSDIASVTE